MNAEQTDYKVDRGRAMTQHYSVSPLYAIFGVLITPKFQSLKSERKEETPSLADNDEEKMTLLNR